MTKNFWYVQAWSDPDYAPKTFRFDGNLTLEEVKQKTQESLSQLFMQSKRYVNIFKVDESFSCEMMQGKSA